MIPFLTAALLAASPLWYEGQLLCPFYCTPKWACDAVHPCNPQAHKPCAAKYCPTYRKGKQP